MQQKAKIQQKGTTKLGIISGKDQKTNVWGNEKDKRRKGTKESINKKLKERQNYRSSKDVKKMKDDMMCVLCNKFENIHKMDKFHGGRGRIDFRESRKL